MNVLMISRDKKVLDKSSAVAERMVKYGQLCDQLVIIVFNVGQEKEVQLADNIWVYPTNSLSRFFCWRDAYQQALRLGWQVAHQHVVDDVGKCGGRVSHLITVQDPFETALAGWLAKKKFGWPLQIQIHTDFLSPYFARESWLNKIRVRLAKWLLTKADGIRVASLRIKRSLVEQLQIDERKISALPIYVDVPKIRNHQPGLDLHRKCQTDFVILTMARLTKEKNIQLLINVFSGVAREYSNVKLIIVGDGPDKDNLELQVISYKLRDRIVFEPWTDDPVSYYKTADLFVLSSNYEGYALAVVEAMVAGCPVIMTDVGCAREIIKNNENGLVVPVGDCEAMVAAIKDIIKNSNLRRKLVDNGIKTAQNLMTAEEYLNKYREAWDATVVRF